MPIHYEFPVADGDDEGGRRRRRRYDDEGDFDDDRERRPATSSARKDLVTQHWSTKRGKVQIQAVIGLVGYGSGNFVAKVRCTTYPEIFLSDRSNPFGECFHRRYGVSFIRSVSFRSVPFLTMISF